MLRTALRALTVLATIGPASITFAQESIKPLAGPVNSFARDIYSNLAGTEGNLFLSPYSIHSALTMTLEGAKGQTAQQMRSVLHLPDAQNSSGAHGALGKHLRDVQKRSGFDLNIANSLWGEQSVKFLQPFTDTLSKEFGAKLMETDFRRDAEGSRRKINAWVKDQTREKIPELLASGVLTRDTSLVLVNAIYFKADWASPFEKSATSDGEFFANGTEAVTARMMHRQIGANYTENDRLQVLEIPYKMGTTSMLVVLPKQKSGIKAAEAAFTKGDLDGIVAGMKRRQVQLTLPAFKMKLQADLAKKLPEMGMPLAFSDRADFSGMTADEQLKISNVIHEAWVAVDEQGTEAAAATAVNMTVTAMPMIEDVVEFTADHPFLFLIRDSQSGTILFAGRLMKP